MHLKTQFFWPRMYPLEMSSEELLDHLTITLQRQHQKNLLSNITTWLCRPWSLACPTLNHPLPWLCYGQWDINEICCEVPKKVFGFEGLLPLLIFLPWVLQPWGKAENITVSLPWHHPAIARHHWAIANAQVSPHYLSCEKINPTVLNHHQQILLL